MSGAQQRRGRAARAMWGSARLRLVFASMMIMSVGCGSSVRSSLRDAEDEGRGPDGLVVVYDDHSTRFGGERIELDAEGVLTLQRFRPAMGGDAEVAESLRGRLPAEGIREVVALLVEIEAWKQHDNAQASVNESRAELELRVGPDRTRVWEWVDDLDANQRLVRVERLLVRLARDLEPLPDSETEGAAAGEATDGEASDETAGGADERAVQGIAPVQITDTSRPRR